MGFLLGAIHYLPDLPLCLSLPINAASASTPSHAAVASGIQPAMPTIYNYQQHLTAHDDLSLEA